jgi:hypothetical protein
MKTNPTFPPSRRTDPQRRAERDIYQAVEASSVPGRALYEVKAARNAKQVDILLWAEAVATFGAQLKGGTYVIRDGELCLVTDQGLVPKPGLLAAVWDSVMAIPEFIQRKLGRGMYIIPVLGLPDMEENEAIRDMAARRQVEVIFGKADWVQRLVDLASCHPIRHRPTEESIEQEALAIMPELAPDTNSPSPQVVIHNVENLHLHVGQEVVATLGLPDLTTEG